MRQNHDWKNYNYEAYDDFEEQETFEKFHNGGKGPRRKDKREVERRREKQSKDKNQK